MNVIDQIEVKFQNGAPLWIYVQELVALTDPSGNVVSTVPHRTPMDPGDPRVQTYLGQAVSDAAVEHQRLVSEIGTAQADLASTRETLAAVTGQNNALKMGNLALQDELTATREGSAAMVAGLRTQLDGAVGQVAALQGDLAAARNDAAAVAAGLQSQLAEAQAQIAALQAAAVPQVSLAP